jgi:hypothetical protein
MTDDAVSGIVERLRGLADDLHGYDADACHDAADEIERLREKVQDLRMYAEQDAWVIERLRAENADLWEFIEDMPSGPESFNQFIHESQTGRIGGAE